MPRIKMRSELAHVLDSRNRSDLQDAGQGLASDSAGPLDVALLHLDIRKLEEHFRTSPCTARRPQRHQSRLQGALRRLGLAEPAVARPGEDFEPAAVEAVHPAWVFFRAGSFESRFGALQRGEAVLSVTNGRQCLSLEPVQPGAGR